MVIHSKGQKMETLIAQMFSITFDSPHQRGAFTHDSLIELTFGTQADLNQDNI